jgi:DNA-binding transcriptional MerR regulator
MLRYVERVGLVAPPRNGSGYRVYGPGELQRLRTLRELLARFDCTLSDVAFAQRMRGDRSLEEALASWFQAEPKKPQGVAGSDWLRFEQEKHQRLLALAS